MKIAIVHDWLYTYAGAERVLEQVLQCFPDADLFSLIDTILEDERNFILNKLVKTSFIQKLPWAKTRHRGYLFLMPLAIEQFDLSEYDLIISSSHAVAKGVLTGPNQLHICYCHSPIRYAWDMQHQYLKEAKLTSGIKSWFARYLLHKVRLWDYRTANGVDYFIANSKFIARRIYKIYRREAQVIYPPVDTNLFESSDIPRKGYYLAASRMVPYKKMLLIAETFSYLPEKQLKIVGIGPEARKIRELAAKHPHIEYLEFVATQKLIKLMQEARAFIFAAEEDFGIIPLEAQACGTPVIAFRRGGLSETINNNSIDPSGVFFEEQNIASIIDAIKRFEQMPIINAKTCSDNAQRFSIDRFCHEFKTAVLTKYQEFRAGL